MYEDEKGVIQINSATLVDVSTIFLRVAPFCRPTDGDITVIVMTSAPPTPFLPRQEIKRPILRNVSTSLESLWVVHK